MTAAVITYMETSMLIQTYILLLNLAVVSVTDLKINRYMFKFVLVLEFSSDINKFVKIQNVLIPLIFVFIHLILNFIRCIIGYYLLEDCNNLIVLLLSMYKRNIGN